MKYRTSPLGLNPVFFLAALIFASGAAVTAAVAGAPVIIESAADPEDFVPSGWRLEHSVRGDLNGDASDDIALVLRKPYKPPTQAEDADAGAAFDPMQRILVVALHEKTSGHYRLAHRDHTLIPARFSANVEDYLAGLDPLEISKGVLRLRLDVFLSAGGWETSSRTFSFRLKGKAFTLIGFDRTITHRGTGRHEEVSINYLTGRAKLGQGSIEDDALKVTWKTIPQRALMTIGDVGNGLEFDPEY